MRVIILLVVIIISLSGCVQQDIHNHDDYVYNHKGIIRIGYSNELYTYYEFALAGDKIAYRSSTRNSNSDNKETVSSGVYIPDDREYSVYQDIIDICNSGNNIEAYSKSIGQIIYRIVYQKPDEILISKEATGDWDTLYEDGDINEDGSLTVEESCKYAISRILGAIG